MNIIVKVKKIGIILLATLIFFTGSFAFPNTEQKAHAVGFGLAIPGGVTLGAGTYALGALGVAGIVGLAGYAEYEEEINAHAKGVWEGGTQVAKDSLNVSIDMARGAGNGLVALQTDFQNFIDSKLDDIVNRSAGAAIESQEIAGFQMTVVSDYGQKNLRLNKPGYAFYIDGVFVNIGLRTYFGSHRLSMGGKEYIYDGNTDPNYNNYKNMPFNTPAEFLAILSAMGIPASTNIKNMDEVNQMKEYVRPRVQEAWEGMKDAGLVLPVDSAIPLSSVDGSPLTYNPTADNYTGIDGGVYEGTPAWAFPQPKIRVANPDIPGSVPATGVYVDTPVLTGNPAYDDTIINNPAIPKTTTNVQTGVTVGNPDIPNVSNPPIEGEIPPTTPPPSKWEKPPTKKPPNIGALVTTKFPFSLPWDFFGVLGWINAEPKAPVFKLDTGLKTPFGKELKMDMEFKFNFLDPYMGFFRGFIIIGFSLFLILATRRLLGGAG